MLPQWGLCRRPREKPLWRFAAFQIIVSCMGQSCLLFCLLWRSSHNLFLARATAAATGIPSSSPANISALSGDCANTLVSSTSESFNHASASPLSSRLRTDGDATSSVVLAASWIDVDSGDVTTSEVLAASWIDADTLPLALLLLQSLRRW